MRYDRFLSCFVRFVPPYCMKSAPGRGLGRLEGYVLADRVGAGGGDGQGRGDGVLDGDAHGLVQGDLAGRLASWLGAGDELAELGVHVPGGDDAVADGLEQVVAARGEGRQGRAPG